MNASLLPVSLLTALIAVNTALLTASDRHKGRRYHKVFLFAYLRAGL